MHRKQGGEERNRGRDTLEKVKYVLEKEKIALRGENNH
jgi:hypothetical protein